jgi:hypothetical protein
MGKSSAAGAGWVMEGLRPFLVSAPQQMSHRQTERPSRFAAELETLMRAAASPFRHDDPEQSVRTANRLWWAAVCGDVGSFNSCRKPLSARPNACHSALSS